MPLVASTVNQTPNKNTLFNLNGYNQLITGLNGGDNGGSITLGTVTSNTLTVNGANNSSYNGVIGGSGNLAVAGGGSLTLGGQSTFSGTAIVAGGGLLTPSGNGVLSPNAVVQVGSGDSTTGTVDLYGTQQTVAGIQAAGANGGTITDTQGGAVLTVNQAGSDVYSGQLTGGLGLNVSGGGTLSLTNGANSYGGATSINGATLQVASLASGGANDPWGTAC